MDDLESLGWNDFFAAAFEPLKGSGWLPARVVLERRNRYRVHTGREELPAEVSGQLRHGAKSREEFPAVGDWVAVRHCGDVAVIQEVLPRKSKFSRKAAGNRTAEQVVAANVDTVFLISGLDGDFNPRRIERYLTAAWDSGADPVVILNKADLCADAEERRIAIAEVAVGVPVHAVSALTGDGVEVVSPYLQPGRTLGFLGSSGVGKSTLLNQLMGEAVQKVQEVRHKDDRGRHTTTHRELFVLESGGLVIDTPGMRELQLWEGGEGVEATFDDIGELARDCRYRDCEHDTEPDCAVVAAVAAGRLPAERLESYHKLKRELRHIELQQDAVAKWQEKQQLKSVMRSVNKHYRNR